MIWHSSVKPCEAIELPFGMVSGVSQKNGVFDGGLYIPHKEGKVLGGGLLFTGLC